jgi:diguanylate cyclase (GGDEF)-like protein/PAS domain S-box-containing protein
MTDHPGPPDHSRDHLYRSLVEGAGDLVVAFDGEGTVVYVNEVARGLLGRPPEQIMGRSVLDFVHPDDLDRAMQALSLNVEFGSAPGTTAFRIRHADGSWIYLHMTGGHATDDGERRLFSSFSRPSYDRFAMSATLESLLSGASLADALRPVCDTFAWRANGSQIGITWFDGEGRRGVVTTGIEADLVGGGPGHRPSPDEPESPWAQVRRTGVSVTDLDLSGLDAGRRAWARRSGLGAYWIEPITSAVDEPALITVWTREGGRPPIVHALAVETAHSVVELILRWAEQQRQLDHAAFHDPLTGVANRKRFFDVLAASPAGGAILYCDLDRFKPVNDRLGHAAGDELLCLVASRLKSTVRDRDLVARIGGDEFAVLCPGATVVQARDIAERIQGALSEPFRLAGESVQIGISIGVGHASERLDDDTLASADRDLYSVKSGR